MTSYRFKGKEYLAAPVLPNFWRVPTDNDEGDKQSSYAARWRQAGLDAPQFHFVEMNAELVHPQLAKIYTSKKTEIKKSNISYEIVYSVYGAAVLKWTFRLIWRACRHWQEWACN